MCDAEDGLVLVEAARLVDATAGEVQRAAEAISVLTGRSVLVVPGKAVEAQPNDPIEWSVS